MNSPIFDETYRHRHLRALDYPSTPPEQRVVALLSAMRGLALLHLDMSDYDTHPMDVVPQHIVKAMENLGTAVRGMYNEDTGRLDNSLLDEEVIRLINAVGGNPDAS